MANASFGIEHPLVTVHDIEAAAASFVALGFDPTPLGRHPWGTVNQLIMFPDNFIELIAIGDDAAIDADPAGGHLFGRRVRDRLMHGEGISLLALRSADAVADERTAAARGAASAGRVEFRRAVRLPDGTEDEAVVTLAILPDDARPGMACFLCQQHKPLLVWNPDWLRHRNGAEAITRVTYVAADPATTRSRLASVWGADSVRTIDGGINVTTAGGDLEVLGFHAFADRFETTVPGAIASRAPCGAAISVRTNDFEAAHRIASSVPGVAIQRRRLVAPAEAAGGVVLEIHAA